MKMYRCAPAILLLASCSQAPAADAADAAADAAADISAAASPASGPASVTVEGISATRSAPIDDQFIECTSKTKNGNTTRQFFLITDGSVKSYSQMRNFARNMCDPGQPDCALGWQGDKIALYFKTNSGAVNQMLLDVETLAAENQLTTAKDGATLSALTCSSGPFPDGVVIE